jgi:hypothetical protein
MTNNKWKRKFAPYEYHFKYTKTHFYNKKITKGVDYKKMPMW